jgi:hypothetical protein
VPSRKLAGNLKNLVPDYVHETSARIAVGGDNLPRRYRRCSMAFGTFFFQTPQINSQRQAEDCVSGQGAAESGQTTIIQRCGEPKAQHRGENGTDVSVLGIKPGEWLLAVIIWMLWFTTRNLVGDTRQSSERQLRAYVGIENIEIDCPNLSNLNYVKYVPSPGTMSPDVINITVKNFGTTPANKVHVLANWGGIQFGARLPDNFDFPVTDIASLAGPQGLRPTWTKPALFPGQVFVQTIAINNAIGFIHAAAGQITMIVWGRVYYVDMFGQNRETLFCFQFAPANPAGKWFVPYEMHNQAR